MRKIVLSLTVLVVFLLLAVSVAVCQEDDVDIQPPDAHLGQNADTSEEYNLLAQKSGWPSWTSPPVFQGDPKGWKPTLRKMLTSEQSRDRARSAFLLGRIGDKGSADLLAETLKDPNDSIRIQAGIALACVGDSRGVGACREAINNAPSWIKFYAVEALWQLDTEESKQELVLSLASDDPLVGQVIKSAVRDKYRKPVQIKETDKAANEVSADEIWAEAARAYIIEADWWWEQGEMDQAIRCLDTGIMMDPANIENYSSKAWLQWSLGREREAIETLDEEIKAAPEDPQAYFDQGFHFFNTDRFELAETPLRKAVGLDGDQLCIRLYANCLEKNGKFVESLRQWERVVELRPDDSLAKINLEKMKTKVDALRAGQGFM